MARRRLPLWATMALNVLAALVVVSLVQAFAIKLVRIPSGSMERTLRSSEAGGDRVLVNRLAYVAGAKPEPGDIVVFTRPRAWSAEAPWDPRDGIAAVVRAFGDLTGIGPSNGDYLVKRVVARGGQTIACCDAEGRLERNGQGVDEPYVFEDLPFVRGQHDCTTTPRSPRCFSPFAVPDGEFVLLGDHRSASADSLIACRASRPADVAPSPESCVRTVSLGEIVGRVDARIWPLDRFGPVT
ncbi:signal peptidase I [Sinomonas sp. ASV322]|uniref:signal peptidase I n=1 Tax=Sinomonas sp. ASV322 TaxID=3041920 RepID=UPI0027DDA846|nr:signal peptidase I [Sinomonas sp. ASV322]MDQ4501645.1 signal peptidase I [Sinomonas sp. ASV322]